MSKNMPYTIGSTGPEEGEGDADEQLVQQRPSRRIMVPLRGGEIDLIRRALRVYAHVEQQAMSDASKEKDPARADDVRKEARQHVQAAETLSARLLRDPTGERGL